MRTTIRDYVKGCRICQQTKPRNHKPFGFIQPIEPLESKRRVITVDCIAPLPETNNRYSEVMTIVDKLSKMARLIPIKSLINAPETAMRFKEHIHRNHGIPNKIISDRYPTLMSKFWKAFYTSISEQNLLRPLLITLRQMDRVKPPIVRLKGWYGRLRTSRKIIGMSTSSILKSHITQP